MPVWHSSVSMYVGSNGPLHLSQLEQRDMKRGARLAKSLLDGVGEGRGMLFTTDPVGSAIHVQKPLTKREIAMLPEGWMDIPAIDERGSYKLLTV